jgi:hypothetical protein
LSEGSWHLSILGPARIHCARLFDAPQQVRNRVATRVRREAHHADRTGLYVDAVRLRENGVAFRNVERSGTGTSAENEKPGLSFRLQAPGGVWRQINPFEHEVRICDQKRPQVGEPTWHDLKIGRAGVRRCNCALDVKLLMKMFTAGDGWMLSGNLTEPPRSSIAQIWGMKNGVNIPKHMLMLLPEDCGYARFSAERPVACLANEPCNAGDCITLIVAFLSHHRMRC